MFLFNDSKYKERRRNLRRNQTDCEQLLWSKLRNRQCAGQKFFRQYSIGHYILDFYCPSIKLAIELDGGQHDNQKDYDRIRTDYLSANGVKELRFWNNEILDNLDGVYDKILEEIKLLNNP